MENFDLDNFEPTIRIVVIGVGGGGNNAVNRMIDDEIANVEFYVANTDKQALSTSKAPNRIVLGPDITSGLGAGGNPEIGEKAAEASADTIREIINGKGKPANMVFVAAGMGGGTGTGAAPIVAQIAKDSGALVIGIVTRPFTFEGKKRNEYSIAGLNKLKNTVDSLIVVDNDKLLMMYGNADISEAFNHADNVLAQSVKTVVNLILLPSMINLDFADLRSTIQDSGVALIGYGMGSGPNRAKDAANNAINCPLLEAPISGAKRAIISITTGPKVSLFEAQETVNMLVNAAQHDVDVKFGITINPQLNDEIFVSVIASDFDVNIDFSQPIEPVKQITPEILVSQEEKTPPEEENKPTKDEDDILPDFLKDLA